MQAGLDEVRFLFLGSDGLMGIRISNVPLLRTMLVLLQWMLSVAACIETSVGPQQDLDWETDRPARQVNPKTTCYSGVNFEYKECVCQELLIKTVIDLRMKV